MTILFMDSFSHYATAELPLKWNSFASSTSTSINASAGRRGGGAFLAGTTSSGAARYLGAGYSTLVLGAAIYIPNGINQAGRVLGFTDLGVEQFHIAIGLDGTLSARRSTTVLATSVAAVPIATWFYLEVRATFHNTTGAYEVRLNGVNVLSASGVNTRNSTNNSASACGILNYNGSGTLVAVGASGSGSVRVADLYCLDTTGSVANDFLGDVRCDVYLPSGAGATTQFTPSAGSNFQCVDEVSVNSDTDYVSSSTVSQKDTYAFADMTHTPTNIYGVQVVSFAKKDDAGVRSLNHVVRSGGSDTDLASMALNDGYWAHCVVRETDPNTSTAWTQSGFNAAEFGVKVAA